MTDNIIIALISGLIGSLTGGLIAYIGSIQSVKRIEMYRRTGILLILLRTAIYKLHNTVGHPVEVVDNKEIDNAVNELIPFIPIQLKNIFISEWTSYRYDNKLNIKTEPLIYTETSIIKARYIIADKLETLVKCLNDINNYP